MGVTQAFIIRINRAVTLHFLRKLLNQQPQVRYHFKALGPGMSPLWVVFELLINRFLRLSIVAPRFVKS